MIHEIHRVLGNMLYEVGEISPHEVDVLFEAPTRERVERFTRPTISVFLVDLQENTDLRDANFPTTRSSNGAVRRMPPRRVDLRHMVSALSTEREDEHQLLWRALAVLMKYQDLPREFLPPELLAVEPALTARVPKGDDGLRLLDVWSALNQEPHPAFSYIVTAPLELNIARHMPLVLTRTVRYGAIGQTDGRDTFVNIGGVVRGNDGTPRLGVGVSVDGKPDTTTVSGANGWFRLFRVPMGELALAVTDPNGDVHRVVLHVPAESYDIEVE